MSAVFPSPEWLKALEEKLNSDEKYAKTAKNWEGDMLFVIEPDGNLKELVVYYLDLWHGKCRSSAVLASPDEKDASFTLKAPYGNFAKVLQGKLDPMQAMLTRKLSVKGSMAIMMRNVPTVLDFVRCANDITSEII